jgi:hypothetical protein
MPILSENEIKNAEKLYIKDDQTVNEDSLAEYVCQKTELAAERTNAVVLPVVTVRMLLHCYMLARTDLQRTRLGDRAWAGAQPSKL